MTITKEVKVELTHYEIALLICDHLKTKGISVSPKSIHFNIENEPDPSDWRGEFPPIKVFTGASCTGKEIEK